MSDIFTIKTINVTPMLGMCFKSFRIKNDITAKSITEHFNRANSYISKFEKGDIKKIDTDFFSDLCNFISKSDFGIAKFLEEAAKSKNDWDIDTHVSILNLDDLLIEYPVTESLLQDITNYMNKNNISISKLLKRINDNIEIRKMSNYDTCPTNQYFADSKSIAIKFQIPYDYLNDLLQSNIISVHRVILEGILYNMFTLGKEDKARSLAATILREHNMERIADPEIVIYKSTEETRRNLPKDVKQNIAYIIKSLEAIFTLANDKEYVSKRLRLIKENFSDNMGFSFAFMSSDLSALNRCSSEQKQAFLNDVKKLINKYSSESIDELDIYE